MSLAKVIRNGGFGSSINICSKALHPRRNCHKGGSGASYRVGSALAKDYNMAEELLRQLVQVLREGRGQDVGPRKVLDMRGVDLSTFNGEAAIFCDWSFSFK